MSAPPPASGGAPAGGEAARPATSSGMGPGRHRRDPRGFARPLPDALGRWTTWRLDHTADALGALVDGALSETGLTRRTLAVLLLLEDHGSLSRSGLRERMGMDRATVTRVVGELEQDGLVRRLRDPAGGRADAIALHSRGGATLEHGARAARTAHTRFLAPLSIRDRQTLADLLRALEPGAGVAFLSPVTE